MERICQFSADHVAEQLEACSGVLRLIGKESRQHMLGLAVVLRPHKAARFPSMQSVLSRDVSPDHDLDFLLGQNCLPCKQHA